MDGVTDKKTEVGAEMKTETKGKTWKKGGKRDILKNYLHLPLSCSVAIVIPFAD